MDAAAPHAARYLLKVMRGEVKNPDWKRIEVAKFVIDHHLGKPTTKIALPSDAQGRTIIPYSQLVILAEKAEKHQKESSQIVEGEIIE